jgi:hypothetical protein
MILNLDNVLNMILFLYKRLYNGNFIHILQVFLIVHGLKLLGLLYWV